MKNSQFDPKRLILAREKMGITMAEAARRLELSPIGYCRYEHGQRIPSSQTVEAIARCFGTSPDFLYGQTDDMSPDYITIYRKKNEALFNLVTECYSADADVINRLSAYYKEIKPD